MFFENIRSVDISNEWKNKIFLTFDIEWATDEVLNYVLDIICDAKIKTTFFCTHATSILQRMRENCNMELGIHTNFNFLLKNDYRYGKNYKEVIQYY